MNPTQTPTEVVRCFACGAPNPFNTDCQAGTEITPVAVDALSPAEHLRGAACYLNRHGWYQGDMFADPEATFPAACGLGAIRMAVYGTTVIDVDTQDPQDFHDAMAALADYLVMQLDVADPSDAMSAPCGLDMEQIVSDWNDDPNRCAAHVIAACYGAADEWDRLHHNTGGA